MRTKILGVWQVVGISTIALAVAAVALLPDIVFADLGGPYGDTVPDKVVVCHWDESGDGAYKSSGDVSTNAVYNPNNTSSGHNGHSQDIIPPFHYQDGNSVGAYIGKN